MRERAHALAGNRRDRARAVGGDVARPARRPLKGTEGQRDPGRAGRRPGPAAGRVRALIDAEDDLEVVGEAGDGDEAVALVPAAAPTSC